VEGAREEDETEDHPAGAPGLVLRLDGGGRRAGQVRGRVLRPAPRERAGETLYRLLARSAQGDL